MLVSEHGILFNVGSDTERAHTHPELNGVMHVFDAYWHGIRSATGCLPGHKIAISHKLMPSGDALHHLFAYVAHHRVRHIVFQAMSENGLKLAELTKREFGDTVDLYVVTHVSSAQFENHFEMRMLKAMVDGYEVGLFRRLGAIKPRFQGVVPEFWPKTIINMTPRIDGPLPVLREIDAVLLPVENNWRKNLYTNTLAALRCEAVKTLYVVNWPTALENLHDLKKVNWIGFMRPGQIMARAASCGAILHSSLIECQPMTMLEGLAVGTPCLSGKLGVHPEIDAHPLTRLCEVDHVDDVGGLKAGLDDIIALWRRDPDGLLSMIADYVTLRKRLCVESYLEFLS
jgi:glycosyltransferase involved in cell wall biosynthesis